MARQKDRCRYLSQIANSIAECVLHHSLVHVRQVETV
jgi:hypothetical protein